MKHAKPKEPMSKPAKILVGGLLLGAVILGASQKDQAKEVPPQGIGIVQNAQA